MENGNLDDRLSRLEHEVAAIKLAHRFGARCIWIIFGCILLATFTVGIGLLLMIPLLIWTNGAARRELSELRVRFGLDAVEAAGTAGAPGALEPRAAAKAAPAREALNRANTALEEWVDCAENGGPGAGTFCCGTCSVALWRNLLTHGPGKAQRRLAAGMKALKAARDGKGKWKRFPFHYTLLVLGEIESPLALAEIRYAAPVIERALKLPPRGEYAPRRHAVMQRALERV